jgi:hypothetical protein
MKELGGPRAETQRTKTHGDMETKTYIDEYPLEAIVYPARSHEVTQPARLKHDCPQCANERIVERQESGKRLSYDGLSRDHRRRAFSRFNPNTMLPICLSLTTSQTCPMILVVISCWR